MTALARCETAPGVAPRAARFQNDRLTARRRRPAYYSVDSVAMPSLDAFALALPNGKIYGDHVYFTLPGRKKRDRSISLKIKDRGMDAGRDFIVKDHHRDGARTWAEIRALKDFVRERIGLPPLAPSNKRWVQCSDGHYRDREAIRRKRVRENAKRKVERAAKRKTPLRISRPWEAAGMSRATWFRHRAKPVSQIPPTPFQVPRAIVSKQRGRGNGELETGSEIFIDGQARALGRAGHPPHWMMAFGNGGFSFPKKAAGLGGGDSRRFVESRMSDLQSGDLIRYRDGDLYAVMELHPTGRPLPFVRIARPGASFTAGAGDCEFIERPANVLVICRPESPDTGKN